MGKEINTKFVDTVISNMFRVTMSKFLLVIWGGIVGLAVVEFVLRSAGWVYLHNQRELGNKSDVTNGTYRILALGESTTAGFSNSWPRLLEGILNDRDKSRKYQVFNEGISGTTTAFIASRLESYIDEYNPDLVITMMGINDELSDSSLKFEMTWQSRLNLMLNDIRVYKIVQRFFMAMKKQKLIARDKRVNENAYEQPDDEVADFIQQGNFEEAEQILLKQLPWDSTSNTMRTLAWICINTNRVVEARDYLKKAIERNADDAEAYLLLGRMDHMEGNYELAVSELKKSIALNIKNDWAQVELGNVYQAIGETLQAEKVLGVAVEINPYNDYAKNQLLNTLGRKGVEVNGFVYSDDEEKLGVSKVPGWEIVRYHYNLIDEMLQKANIPLAAMQYPMRNVNELKLMLGDPKVIYIGNENFRDGVAHDGYEKYFTDDFGGNFGHTSRLGSQLIANNAAKAILSWLRKGEKGD